MSSPRVVPRAEWLPRGSSWLAQEKELTRQL